MRTFFLRAARSRRQFDCDSLIADEIIKSIACHVEAGIMFSSIVSYTHAKYRGKLFEPDRFGNLNESF